MLLTGKNHPNFSLCVIEFAFPPATASEHFPPCRPFPRKAQGAVEKSKAKALSGEKE